ncbi:MAG: discoidin domain-containing protein, partial [Armatimonadota bacterium]|nr:discoidin domain-containing protein [Armatimonadota bacterium]
MFWLSPALLLLMTADAGAQNLDTAGLKNVCLGAQVEASSNASEPGGRFYCDKAVDGSVSTRWATADHQGPPQWLQVEFAEPTTLDTVVILQVDMPELYANAERMQLAFSAGEPVEATLEDTAAAQIVRLEPRTTTYLRLTITSSYGFEHYLGVRELMAFHDPERRVTVPAPPPPIPKPIPPVYEELKDLHLMTELVSDGRAAISIVKPASGIHDAAAAAIQDAIEEMTGVEVPIIDDRDPGAAVPIESNLIALGNRSTSRLISDLYDRMFTMLDLKYPGRGGYVVRTLHSPFGNGHNVIFVGGSDAEGVNSAAAALADKLREARTVQGKLNLGWTMQIELGEGMVVPEDLQEVRVWEASRQYGNRGTFGWNSISKRMALYHMTGDEHHAREFLRLAFPDEQALAELRRDDAGQIEVERDPLAGAYHYNAHMLIVFWDLIEESPVFTDAERLKVTNAFARQLRHRADDFTGLYYTTEPPVVSGDRHRDWEGVCLYLLGRYFQRDYPAPVWRRCIDAARLHFSSRYNPEGTCATNDHLFWYNTVIAPSLVWTILTDDQRALESGTIDRLLLGQEILSNGRASDWGLQAASLAFLNQAAYL